MGQFVVFRNLVYVVQHYADLKNNLSVNLRSNLIMNMEWGVSSLGFFFTYFQKINVSYTSTLQGFNNNFY